MSLINDTEITIENIIRAGAELVARPSILKRIGERAGAGTSTRSSEHRFEANRIIVKSVATSVIAHA